MTGTTSIRAVSDGVIIRQGSVEVKIWAHQLIQFCTFATDHWERLDSNTTNTREDKNDD